MDGVEVALVVARSLVVLVQGLVVTPTVGRDLVQSAHAEVTTTIELRFNIPIVLSFSVCMLKLVGRIHRNLIIGVVECGIVILQFIIIVQETLAYLLVAIIVRRITENRRRNMVQKELTAFYERGHLPLGKQRKQQQNKNFTPEPHGERRLVSTSGDKMVTGLGFSGEKYHRLSTYTV